MRLLLKTGGWEDLHCRISIKGKKEGWESSGGGGAEMERFVVLSFLYKTRNSIYIKDGC